MIKILKSASFFSPPQWRTLVEKLSSLLESAEKDQSGNRQPAREGRRERVWGEPEDAASPVKQGNPVAARLKEICFSVNRFN